MVRVAINGFGRIGRMALRAGLENYKDQIEFVAINDLAPPATSAHLFQYDSVHGPLPFKVSTHDSEISVEGHRIKMLSEPDPKKLPWKDMNVDIVLECSGVFTSHEKASQHLEAGAKKVLISGPSGDADKIIVYGVNHESMTAEDLIISNASCTTNCLAPIAFALNKELGIEKGFMTTIHAYTGDQRIIDTAHADLRRARAAGVSMIPTSTGAAKMVGKVLPELNGKLDGTAIRVPTSNVSVVDFNFITSTKTSVEEINSILESYANGPLKGVLGINDLPLVSIDFNHSSFSSIYDKTQTFLMDQNFGRILSWYDNEWGFSNRMCDMALYMKNMS